MKDSQLAVATALGLLVLFVFVVVGGFRFVLGGDDPAAADAPVSSGPVAARPAGLTGFDRIEIRDNWEVEIVRGDDWSVELNVPEDSTDDLDVVVEGDRLVLDAGGSARWSWGWFGNDEQRSARIVMPALEGIVVAGSTDLSLAGFDGDSLEVEVAGAANIEADGGRYDRLTLTINGAGNFELGSMPVVDAEVHLAGAGNVELRMAGGVLSGSLSGFGNVEYSGAVAEERVTVSGFGNVGPKQ